MPPIRSRSPIGTVALPTEMIVKVKICGITAMEDAQAALVAGADAVGFMFHEPSPRAVSLAQAADISRRLPPFISKVGVFVNPGRDLVDRALELVALDALQFHGEETPEFCACYPQHKLIKAFRVRDESSLAFLDDYRAVADAWLLDSYLPDRHGGTGEVFNWKLAAQTKTHQKPIILAGGLRPGNVRDAIHTVRPYAVDVSSGVEVQPGKKDHAKITAFIQNVRLAAEEI